MAQKRGQRFEEGENANLESFVKPIKDFEIKCKQRYNYRYPNDKYICKEHQCTSSKCNCPPRGCRCKCNKRKKYFIPDAVLWYKNKYWVIIEHKDYKTKMANSQVLKLFYDRCELGNIIGYPGTAVMYVSETTTMALAAVHFAESEHIDIYHKTSTTTKELFEILVGRLIEEEKDTHWLSQPACQPLHPGQALVITANSPVITSLFECNVFLGSHVPHYFQCISGHLIHIILCYICGPMFQCCPICQDLLRKIAMEEFAAYEGVHASWLLYR